MTIYLLNGIIYTWLYKDRSVKGVVMNGIQGVLNYQKNVLTKIVVVPIGIKTSGNKADQEKHSITDRGRTGDKQGG